MLHLHVAFNHKIHSKMCSMSSISSWLVNGNSKIYVSFSFFIGKFLKVENMLTSQTISKFSHVETTTFGIPVRRQEYMVHGPNTGFYGPLINQSELCRIRQSHMIKATTNSTRIWYKLDSTREELTGLSKQELTESSQHKTLLRCRTLSRNFAMNMRSMNWILQFAPNNIMYRNVIAQAEIETSKHDRPLSPQ